MERSHASNSIEQKGTAQESTLLSFLLNYVSVAVPTGAASAAFTGLWRCASAFQLHTLLSFRRSSSLMAGIIFNVIDPWDWAWEKRNGFLLWKQDKDTMQTIQAPVQELAADSSEL